MKRLFLALFLAGCTHVDGWMEGRNVAGAAWRMQPNRCFSGRRLLFDGAEVESTGSDPHSVSIVADRVDGDRVVVVNAATHERVVFDASKCSQFQPRLFEHGERWFGRHPIDGSITLACGDGTHSLRGSIAFAGCD
jgi:hypothetical protein